MEMKGFIEVTSTYKNKKHLINISHIEEVVENIIYLDVIVDELYNQDKLECQETYEEIKAKIERASEWEK